MLLATVFAFTLFGCGGHSEETQSSCFDIQPSANQGVYGCVVSFNDTPSFYTVVVDGFVVNAFPSNVLTRYPYGPAAPVATAKSDARGFYELSLPPGGYSLCSSSYQCIEISIGPGAILRWNYDTPAGWFRSSKTASH